ncbi:MAG TPA: hypothetical protein VD948_13230, partial [Rhodothermales bacterium]|nr:hypothetical protein [Rhodothermales bacterium]
MEPDNTSRKRANGGAAKTPSASKTVSNSTGASQDPAANPDAEWSPATHGETGPPAGTSGTETPPPTGTTTAPSTAEAEWSPATGGTAPTSEMGTSTSSDGQ